MRTPNVPCDCSDCIQDLKRCGCDACRQELKTIHDYSVRVVQRIDEILVHRRRLQARRKRLGIRATPAVAGQPTIWPAGSCQRSKRTMSKTP